MLEKTPTKSNQLGFVEQSLEKLETAINYADGMVKTGVLPKHYYDQNGNPKPGAAQSVLLVIQMGREIGMSNLQAIQQIVPVNNTLSIRGDGAKALIMASRICENWVEEEIGAGDGYGIKITAKRKDTGEVKSVSFTISDAKRAGLWITDEMVAKNDRLKFSPWYKYGRTRMLKYRALGFLCRDLFPDILQGMVTLEEAEDYGRESSKVETDNGIVTNANTEKQESMNEGAATKVETKAARGPAKSATTAPKKEEPVQTPIVVETKINEESATLSFEDKLKTATLNPEFVKNNKDEVKTYLNDKFIALKFLSTDEFIQRSGTPQLTLNIAAKMLEYFRDNKYEQMCIDMYGQIIHPPAAEMLAPKEEKAVNYKFDSRFVIPKETPRSFDQELLVMDYLAQVGKTSLQMKEYAESIGYKDDQDFLANGKSEEIDKFLVS